VYVNKGSIMEFTMLVNINILCCLCEIQPTSHIHSTDASLQRLVKQNVMSPSPLFSILTRSGCKISVECN